MHKKRRPEDHGFNIWRSYSDMMAGVLLLFVLIAVFFQELYLSVNKHCFQKLLSEKYGEITYLFKSDILFLSKVYILFPFFRRIL